MKVKFKSIKSPHFYPQMGGVWYPNWLGLEVPHLNPCKRMKGGKKSSNVTLLTPGWSPYSQSAKGLDFRKIN